MLYAGLGRKQAGMARPAAVALRRALGSCRLTDASTGKLWTVDYREGAEERAIATLCRLARKKKLARFRRLSQPSGGAMSGIYDGAGVCGRAIAQYDHSRDRTVYRLDILAST